MIVKEQEEREYRLKLLEEQKRNEKVEQERLMKLYLQQEEQRAQKAKQQEIEIAQ